MSTERLPGHKFSWSVMGGGTYADACSCGWRGPLTFAATRETGIGVNYDKHIDELSENAQPGATGEGS